jgi:hypothetical protein
MNKQTMALVLSTLIVAAGCVIDASVFEKRGNTSRIEYFGNGNTEGRPPVDTRAYSPGDTVIVMGKPAGLKKNNLAFLGWRDYTDRLYQPGDRIIIGEEYIFLYAAWEDELGFMYTLASGEATITGCDKTFSRLIIPDTLAGNPVTGIADGAFYNEYLYELWLPEQLGSIGNNAFANNGIAALIIPGAVRKIGINAFQRNNLASLELGAALETIGAYAFSDNRLTILLLPPALRSIGEGAFNLNNITVIEIGGNVEIKSDGSMGVNGGTFRDYYAAKGKAAAIYRSANRAWKQPYFAKPE